MNTAIERVKEKRDDWRSPCLGMRETTKLHKAAERALRVLIAITFLFSISSCNDRRGLADDLREGASDVDGPGADTSNGGVDAADVAPEDLTPDDTAPEDGAPEDVAPEDISELDTTPRDDAFVDDVPDLHEASDVPADVVEDAGDIEPEPPCEPSGTLRYTDSQFLDDPLLPRWGFASALAPIDVDTDGLDEVIAYHSGGFHQDRLLLVRNAPGLLQPIESPGALAPPFAAGMLRDVESGDLMPAIAVRTDAVLGVHHVREATGGMLLEAFALPDSLQEPMQRDELSVSVVAERAWVSGEGERSMLTLRGGVLEERACDATLVDPLVYDAASGRVWGLTALADGQQRFGSLDPDNCDTAPELSPNFASAEGVTPVIAQHSDGRWLVLAVTPDDVVSYDGDSLERWAHALTPRAEGVVRAPTPLTAVRRAGTDSDIVLGHRFQLDPFERVASFATHAAPLARSGLSHYVSGYGRGLMLHPLVPSSLAPPSVMPTPSGRSHWAEFEGEPGMFISNTYRATVPNAAEPFDVVVTEDRLEFPETPIPPDMQSLGSEGVAVDAEGRFVRSEFGVWPILSGSEIGFDVVPEDSDVPLSFDDVWASGIRDGLLQSVVSYRSAGGVPRPEWPAGLAWSRVQEGRILRGTAAPPGRGSRYRVIRDALRQDSWYALTTGSPGPDELVGYALDVQTGEIRPVDLAVDVGFFDYQIIEILGSASEGQILVGTSNRFAVVEVREGTSRVLASTVLESGRWVAPPPTSGFVSSSQAASHRGVTFVDGRGLIWTVDVGGAITQVAGLPTASFASRGDLNGDGLVDFLLNPPDYPGFSLLYFGQCVPE